MFYIETVTAFPTDYTEMTEVAKNKLRTKARPKLMGRVENMGTYDVIFWAIRIGGDSPPMAVFTFLASYNLSGKMQVQRQQMCRVGSISLIFH